jgi:hypothetical protein
LVLSVFNLKALIPSDFEERPWVGGEIKEEMSTESLSDHENGKRIDEDMPHQPIKEGKRKVSIVLTESGFRKFITQYERKMSQRVQYHLSGEQLTYRDCIREQVRHFARYLKGEENEYQPAPLR